MTDERNTEGEGDDIRRLIRRSPQGTTNLAVFCCQLSILLNNPRNGDSHPPPGAITTRGK